MKEATVTLELPMSLYAQFIRIATNVEDVKKAIQQMNANSVHHDENR